MQKHSVSFKVHREEIKWMKVYHPAKSRWLCSLPSMVLLFHGSLDGWFPALAILSYFQLIIQSLSVSRFLVFHSKQFSYQALPLAFSFIALMHVVRLGVLESQLLHLWITEPYRESFFSFFPKLCLHSSILCILFCILLSHYFFLCQDNRAALPISFLS